MYLALCPAIIGTLWISGRWLIADDAMAANAHGNLLLAGLHILRLHGKASSQGSQDRRNLHQLFHGARVQS